MTYKGFSTYAAIELCNGDFDALSPTQLHLECENLSLNPSIFAFD